MPLPGIGRSARHRKPMPIVPPQNVAGNAMVLVIAIMTFLSCLTLGAVTLVRDTAAIWQNEIAREATIQVKPAEGFDISIALDQAVAIASEFRGVRSATIVDDAATARLLEPWLGSGIDLEELPVPRLVTITIDPDNPPDFAAMREAITGNVPYASLDDHRTWVDRLVTMARTTVAIGVSVLVLILSATLLTVVFATRGAMSGNGHVIEVLHFGLHRPPVPQPLSGDRHEGRSNGRRPCHAGVSGLLLVVEPQSGYAGGRSGGGTVRQLCDRAGRLCRRRHHRHRSCDPDGGNHAHHCGFLSQRS